MDQIALFIHVKEDIPGKLGKYSEVFGVWIASRTCEGMQQMEQLTKKEFWVKYASKTDKGNIQGAATLAYVCAAISLALGVSLGNFAVVVDVVLIVGLALGVQLARSRVCAVLLLIYSFINLIVMTIESGRVSGWWLILVGIWAVKGTFKLHKEYQQFLQDGTLPPHPQPETPVDSKRTAKQVFATVLPFIGMFLGIFIIWLSISPAFLEFLVGNAPFPKALLQGYRNWYIAILGAVVVAVLLTVVGVILSARKGLRTWKSIVIMVVSLAFPIFFGGAMIASENIPALLYQANEDLAQIESGQLQEATVWFSPKSRTARLPGPYGKGQPEPVTDYRGIGDDTGRKWVDFYVPNCLHFSLDQSALYNENESINWNETHARQYLVHYTENFRLVVSVEPVDSIPQSLSQTLG